MSNKKLFLINGLLNFLFSPLRFGFNLYLASLLSPKEYGQMVVPTLIISFSEFLIDSGFRTSLIQKSSLNIKHSSTIYIFNLVISLSISIILIISTNNIFNFLIFKNIKVLIILAALILLIKSFSMIPEARLQIKSKFSFLLFTEFISNIFAYIIIIFYTKYFDKQYSLILLYLISSTLYTILLNLKEKFYPEIKNFSRKLIFFHWRTGKKILTQGFLELFTDKIDELSMVKFINTSNLGIYSKGRELSNTIGVVGSKFFSRPWFSIMSKFSNNKTYFKGKFLLANYLLSFFFIIILITSNYFGILFISKFLGDKWVGLILYYKYFTLFSILYMMVVFNKYTILSLGLFNSNLKIEKYYVVVKILLLSIYLYLSYTNNNVKTIIIIILLDLSSKLFMFFLQFKLIAKHLNIITNTFFINTIFLIIVSYFFINNQNYIFTILSILFLIYYLIYILKLYRKGKTHAIN